MKGGISGQVDNMGKPLCFRLKTFIPMSFAVQDSVSSAVTLHSPFDISCSKKFIVVSMKELWIFLKCIQYQRTKVYN